MANTKPASLLDALIPLGTLMALLAASVLIYGDGSSSGPNQIALLLAAFCASLVGLKNGFSWHQLEEAMIKGISLSLGAILILLSVGALIGTWMLSGTVPTLIYYGLQVINPSWFYAATCVLCGIVAMSIGSSWTTAGTIGVALLGVGQGLGMDNAITAGAIISGAYFGDKLSPLSETTNLAPAVAGSNLFDHIQHMLWTTIPSYVLALLLFVILGFSADSAMQPQRIIEISNVLEANFNIGVAMFVPLIVLLVLAVKKMPAFPAVFVGALLGGVWALLFQQKLLITITGNEAGLLEQVKLFWQAMFDGFSITTGDVAIDKLLSRGGMSSMLNTTWLIMMALVFGAVMEKVGLLQVIVRGILKLAKSTGSLITATICTAIGANVIAADQYMSIVMPGRMFKEEYERRGLAPVNLSRTLEDGGTITSPLIPWNTCGAYMHSVLAVGPFEYIFYSFFNLINPLLAVIYAYLGVKILKLPAPSGVRETIKVS